jgi:hypothetical protein
MRQRHPFGIDAFVVLLDHLHAIWPSPEGDADFAAAFSRSLSKTEAVSASPDRKRERGIWQRRSWEDTTPSAGDAALKFFRKVARRVSGFSKVAEAGANLALPGAGGAVGGILQAVENVAQTGNRGWSYDPA